ncbi:hypothetical protein EJB05_49984 [Eragrostis curvula]|uniref:Uncharacterized protein n=1 Tax=Eragrostis curvula TaxID=38414 RepID=A0A5J9SZK1_9POAL|nr:hypothetical protein EJB05_49984 [Eragrostis curvula]
MLSSPFRKNTAPCGVTIQLKSEQVSQVPKGRGRKREMADKDEDSVEEGRSYPSLCNWYKDEYSVEECRAYPSLRNWYKDGDSDEEGCVSPSRFNWYKD